MISHSPPIFSHSPPVSFLADYMSNHHHHNHHQQHQHRQPLNYIDDSNRTATRFCRPQVITLASKAIVNSASNAVVGQHRPNTPVNGMRANYQRMISAPILLVPNQPKSCLSRKSCLQKKLLKKEQNDTNTNDRVDVQDITNTENEDTNNSNDTSLTFKDQQFEQSLNRKKVVFADDEGLSLTEVRIMSEPSNVPPYWSVKFLEQITQGLVSPHPPDEWTVDFKQPASDYLTFRQKIESDYVSLENVIVKDEESIVVGTIKVKNVSFEKEVIVRVTWDDWKNQQDIFCTFARAYGSTTTYAHVVFDTFSFKIPLPPSSKRLEFCICFRAKNKEFWDNNSNKNYTITKRSPFYYNALSPYEKNTSRNSCHHVVSQLTEALEHTKENHLDNDSHSEPSPYW